MVRQEATASESAQQAVQGGGIQINNYGAGAAPAEPAVSIAPPFGLRDERRPLRGRSKLLASFADATARVHVVHGLGGCGKTTLALEAAYLARQRGTEVWWVSAAEPDGLVAGMRAIGRRLGLTDAQLSQGDACDIVWHRLSAKSNPWLLVFDDADDPRILAGPGASVGDGRGWLRPVESAAGQVLVTSRDGSDANWGSWCIRHRLPMLPADDAARVLTDRAGNCCTDEEARALAERLGGLPLALRIAGSYLAESTAVPAPFAEPGLIRTFRQYREALDVGDLDRAFPAPGTGEVTQHQARGLVGRTWDLSLDLLDARQLPEARSLLRLLSCFAGAPIPYELLLHPVTMSQSPLFAGITGPRLWQAMQALESFGLIELDVDHQAHTPVAQLHPLVRDTSSPIRVLALAEESLWLKLLMSLVGAAGERAGLDPQETPETSPRAWLVSLHVVHVVRRVLDLKNMQVLNIHRKEGWTRPHAIPALAGTAGTALAVASMVSASWEMVSITWQETRDCVKHLFERGGQSDSRAALVRLDSSQAALAGLRGDAREQAFKAQQDIWRVQFSDLLERNPEVAEELFDLLADLLGVQTRSG